MIFHLLAAIAILMYFASPALGDTIVFGWFSPEGAYEYTDDINRVPVAHLHSVQRIEVDGLQMYRYYTHDEFPFVPMNLPEAAEILVEEALENVVETEEVAVDTRRRKRHRSDR
jgi:hypothetical protein